MISEFRASHFHGNIDLIPLAILLREYLNRNLLLSKIEVTNYLLNQSICAYSKAFYKIPIPSSINQTTKLRELVRYSSMFFGMVFIFSL